MFVGLVARLLMVPAAYYDGEAVQVCDLAADHDGVSAKLLAHFTGILTIPCK